MTEGERKDIQTYLAIMDFSLKRHDFRANLEWQITLAVWTLLIAVIAFFIAQKASIPNWCSLLVSAPIVAFHWYWLHYIYKGHDQWKRRMNFWADKAQITALGEDSPDFLKVRVTDPDKDHSSAFLWQGKPVYLAATILLAIILELAPRLIQYGS